MSSHFPPHDLHRPKKEQPHFKHQVAAKAINSGIAAIVSTVLMYPLDLSKTRLQNQRNSRDSTQLYTSLIDCFRKIRKAEGIRGLYRGCAMNACLIAPEKTIKLASNDLIRQYLKKNDGSSSLSMSKEIFAGATAGLAQSFLSTPMDLLKINMQDAGRLAAMSKSTLEGNMSSRRVLIDLLKKHGFAGLFRGFGATGGRNIFFSVVYFPVFYKINDWSPKNIKESGSLSSSTWAFLSGCVAGGVGAAAATPWDVVKTRMQRLKLAKCDVPYNGILDAFVKIFKTEGPFALMKGAGIRTVVIAPLFGILQAVYYLGIGEYILNQKDD